MKRFHARGRGRGASIMKPFSQITVVVRQVEEDKTEKKSRKEVRVEARRGGQGGQVMGQKVNPVGLRLGINRTWDSRWFAARGEYGKLLHEDRAIRAHIMKQQRRPASRRSSSSARTRSAALRCTRRVPAF